MWNTRLSWRIKIISALVSLSFFCTAIFLRTYGPPQNLPYGYSYNPTITSPTQSSPDGTSQSYSSSNSHIPHAEHTEFDLDAPNPAENRTTFDIVISYYGENLEKVAKQLDLLKAIPQLAQYDEIRTFFYTKNPSADLVAIEQLLGGPAVLLPNRGRESGTYLTHIIENWDDLGSHTMFVQADMHQPEDGLRRVTESLVPPSKDSSPSTGVLTMGVLADCLCTACHDKWNGARTWSRIPEIYAVLNHELCPKNVLLTYSGQMVVSRQRIWNRPREAYQYLKDVLESDLEHFIHSDPRQEGEFHDTVENPYFGHMFERIWMILWECGDTRPLDACGPQNFRKPEDPMSSCQCMDE
jgi:hypothetical protein